MLAFRLLRHALWQIFGNMRAALVLSVLPVAVAVMASLIRSGAPGGSGEGAGMAASAVAVNLATLALLALSFASLATAWHRFVLLEEWPGPMRGVGRAQFGYLWACMAVALIAGLVVSAAYLVAYAAMTAFAWGFGALVVLNLVLVLVITVMVLRLGTGLAGVAIGAASPLTTSWRATGHYPGTLVLLGLLVSILQIATGLPTLLPGLAGLVAVPVTAWLNTLLSLSLITTLWGHFVEGRALR